MIGPPGVELLRFLILYLNGLVSVLVAKWRLISHERAGLSYRHVKSGAPSYHVLTIARVDSSYELRQSQETTSTFFHIQIYRYPDEQIDDLDYAPFPLSHATRSKRKRRLHHILRQAELCIFIA